MSTIPARLATVIPRYEQDDEIAQCRAHFSWRLPPKMLPETPWDSCIYSSDSLTEVENGRAYLISWSLGDRGERRRHARDKRADCDLHRSTDHEGQEAVGSQAKTVGGRSG